MKYALRKLIAFVFLGGIFWFIYQDLDNLDKPWFMHALGLIAVAFAFFWLLIPIVVVQYRIHRRLAKNRARHSQWLAAGGVPGLHPHPVKKSAGAGRGPRVASIADDDKLFLHEKGTLYTGLDAVGFDFIRNAARPVGRPSDVAFPGFKRTCCIAQRTHCYFTDRRVAFAGKDLDFGVQYDEIRGFSVMPGGIVLDVANGDSSAKFAFTFQNPLIAADILRFLQKGE